MRDEVVVKIFDTLQRTPGTENPCDALVFNFEVNREWERKIPHYPSITQKHS
jgi:hypothetical protein